MAERSHSSFQRKLESNRASLQVEPAALDASLRWHDGYTHG
jgi:hypothetical protein